MSESGHGLSDAELVAMLAYFLPAVIAFSRGHLSAWAILALNVLLGWTGLAWVVAFIWSLTGNTRRGLASATIVVRDAPAPSVIVTTNVIQHAPALATMSASPAVALPPPPHGPGPARALGLELHTSQAGRAYYRNAIPAAEPGYLSFEGDAFFTYEIVGESHYQRDLEEIVGGSRDAPVYFRVIAFVFPEPDNPHDPDAVVVVVRERRVGYVKRMETAAFRQALAESGVAQCHALIAGGGDHSAPYSVRLDVIFPLRLRA